MPTTLLLSTLSTNNTALALVMRATNALQQDAPPENNLPENWLVDLFPHANTQEHLQKHIGEDATYTQKPALIAGLQKIYQYCVQHAHHPLFSDEKRAIQSKLHEDIIYCTIGFHNRVNEVLLSFDRPKTFAELLQVIREDLVSRLARKYSNDVHDINFFNRVAHDSGYGVRCINEHDPFINFNRDDVLGCLEKYFANNFTPYHLSFLITEYLRSFIADCYCGEIKKGYEFGDAQKIASILQSYLNDESVTTRTTPYEFFLATEQNDDDISYDIYCDLNWPKIQRHALRKIEKKYLNDTTCNLFTILDYISYEFMYPKRRIPDVLEHLPRANLAPVLLEFYQRASVALLDKLFKTHSFIIFTGSRTVNIFHPILQINKKTYFHLVDFVSHRQPEDFKTSCFQLLKYKQSLFADLIAMLPDAPDTLAQVTCLLDQKNENHITLLEKMLRNAPESFHALLLMAPSYPNLLKKIIDMLSLENLLGWTFLHLIAQQTPEAFDSLLSMAQSSADLLQKITYVLSLETQNGWTFLHLITRRALKSFSILLCMVKLHPVLLNTIIDTLGMKIPNGRTLLDLIAEFMPETLSFIFSMDKLHPDFLTSMHNALSVSMQTTLYVFVKQAPEAFFMLLFTMKCNAALLAKFSKVFAAQDDNNWGITHHVLCYCTKSEVDVFIKMMMNHPITRTIFLEALSHKTKSFDGAPVPTAHPELGLYLLRRKGIIAPSDNTKWASFFTAYSHHAPAHKPPLTQRKKTQEKIRLQRAENKLRAKMRWQ